MEKDQAHKIDETPYLIMYDHKEIQDDATFLERKQSQYCSLTHLLDLSSPPLASTHRVDCLANVPLVCSSPMRHYCKLIAELPDRLSRLSST